MQHTNMRESLIKIHSRYYMCQVNTNPMISQVGYLQVVGEWLTKLDFRHRHAAPVGLLTHTHIMLPFISWKRH